VAASTPIVRPWNAPRSDTISCFAQAPNAPAPRWRPAGTSVRAHRAANLNAPSLASAPELQKKARAANECDTSHSASRSPGSVRNRLDTCTSPLERLAHRVAAPGRRSRAR
jgi:hypothetical protein